MADLTLSGYNISSPYMLAYPYSGGFGTKYSDPAAAPDQPLYQARPQGGYMVCTWGNWSPHTCAYPWSSGFGTKVTAPSNNPGMYIQDHQRISSGPIICATWPDLYYFVWVWPFSGGYGTGYFQATGVSISAPTRVAISEAETDICFATGTSYGFQAFPLSGATLGSQYPGIVSSAYGNGQSVGFNDNPVTDLVGGHLGGSPWVTAWPFCHGVGALTKYSNPATAPNSGIWGAIFFDENTIMLACGSSPYIYAYDFDPAAYGGGYTLEVNGHNVSVGGMSFLDEVLEVNFHEAYLAFTPGGGWGTKYSNPSTLPGGSSYDIATDGSDVVVAGGSPSPYCSAYPWSSGWGTKRSAPGTAPDDVVNAADIH